MIIGLVGPMASGKGVVSQYIQDNYQAGYHRFSHMLRDVVRRLGIEESRENLQKISICLRENFGQNLMAHAIKHEVENDDKEIVMIDGIRREGDVTYLKELPNFILVYIDSDIKTRYDRTITRAENATDKDKTFEQFENDHLADTETTIPPLKEISHEVIDNDGSLEELYEKFDNIIKKHNEN